MMIRSDCQHVFVKYQNSTVGLDGRCTGVARGVPGTRHLAGSK